MEIVETRKTGLISKLFLELLFTKDTKIIAEGLKNQFSKTWSLKYASLTKRTPLNLLLILFVLVGTLFGSPFLNISSSILYGFVFLTFSVIFSILLVKKLTSSVRFLICYPILIEMIMIASVGFILFGIHTLLTFLIVPFLLHLLFVREAVLAMSGLGYSHLKELAMISYDNNYERDEIYAKFQEYKMEENLASILNVNNFSIEERNWNTERGQEYVPSFASIKRGYDYDGLNETSVMRYEHYYTLKEKMKIMYAELIKANTGQK